MTLVLSLIHPKAIIMGADSRKTGYYTPVNFETLKPIGDTKIEWEDINKLFVVHGKGCVSMWGDITRAEKKVGPYLLSRAETIRGPDELADCMMHFLKEEIRADEGDDIGFHVGGFRSDGSKALFHVFWDKDIGPGVDPKKPSDFKKYDHSTCLALYNGKHAIADNVIRFVLALEKEVGIIRWITNHPPEKAVKFTDFVIRYASRVDPTVGGDVKVAMILPENRIQVQVVKSSTE